MTEREYEDDVLRRFVRGEAKYNSLKRARLAYEVESILRDRGRCPRNCSEAVLVDLARIELA